MIGALLGYYLGNIGVLLGMIGVLLGYYWGNIGVIFGLNRGNIGELLG